MHTHISKIPTHQELKSHKTRGLQAERIPWASEQNNINQLLKIPLIKTQRFFVFNRKDLGTRAKLPVLPEAGPGFSPNALNSQNRLIRWVTLLSPVYR